MPLAAEESGGSGDEQEPQPEGGMRLITHSEQSLLVYHWRPPQVFESGVGVVRAGLLGPVNELLPGGEGVGEGSNLKRASDPALW